MATHRDVCTSVATQASSSGARSRDLLDSGPSSHGVAHWRRLRAEVAVKERDVQQLKDDIAAAEQRLSSGESGHIVIRNLADSPAKLSLSRPARHRPKPYPEPLLLRRVDEDIDGVLRQQEEVTRKLADARRVLVREAVSVLGLRKGASKQSHWEIAGLPLPPPEMFRRKLPIHPYSDSQFIGQPASMPPFVTQYISYP
jgi:hypothetical protein